MSTLLQLENICKSFPGVMANDQVCLEVKEGEVHALLGENGAGKSTLMNILYGILKPDEGSIYWKGEEVHINNPHAAVGLGIGMVHQHFMLIPALSVVENVILSSDEAGLIFDKVKASRKILELSERYGLQVEPNSIVQDLSVGQQQRVEILKALYSDCELLILDEPTAVLTPQETDDLFVAVRQLIKEGKSVIIISHKLNEILAISDRITVLRNGNTVKTVDTDNTDEKELARLMVGKDIFFNANKAKGNFRHTVLEVDNLSVSTPVNPRAVNNLSFKVRAGEIYGIAGVDGNGQSELIKAILSIIPKQGGQVFLKSEDITHCTTKEIFHNKIGHIPENRLTMGVIGELPIFENNSFYNYESEEFSNFLFINWNKEQKYSNRLLEEYNVKAASEKVKLSTLSGGNQQKMVVARELDKHPNLLIAAFPTRGVDIGAMETIHEQIISQRNEGCAVLLVSTELDEIMKLSDTIGVIYEGEILGEMPAEEATTEQIGLLMAGKRNLIA